MVWVQPNAKKNEIVGVSEGFLKIKVKAPPKEGKANRELINFLSDVLGVKTKDIEIVSGDKGRKKVLKIKAQDLRFNYK